MLQKLILDLGELSSDCFELVEGELDGGFARVSPLFEFANCPLVWVGDANKRFIQNVQGIVDKGFLCYRLRRADDFFEWSRFTVRLGGNGGTRDGGIS